MRAREPDEQGVIERDGVRVGYEVHGDGDPTVLLLPSWAILPARHWKAQVPFLARRFRVITLEGRGNGRADRPTDAAAYRDREFVATPWPCWTRSGWPAVVRRGLSAGGRHALQLAAWHPDRARGVITHERPLPGRELAGLPPAADELRGLAEGQQALLAGRLPRLGRVLLHPGVHRTALAQAARGRGGLGAGHRRRDAAADRPRHRAREHPRGRRGGLPAGPLPGAGRARRPGRRRAVPGGGGAGRLDRRRAGHAARQRPRPHPARSGAGQPADPRLRRAGGRPARGPPATWTRPRSRRRRALFVCSPIGLGHVRRDLAIADELRRCAPTWRSTG